MTRDEICRNCKMLPSIHHLEYPCCDQPAGPISEEEYRKLGLTPETHITYEDAVRVAEMTIQPYCLERMKAGGMFSKLM